jgi:hypothetical protein
VRLRRFTELELRLTGLARDLFKLVDDEEAKL